MHYDVIIIGAGYSGLAAALKLRQAHQNVLILEVRNPVAGRVHIQPLGEGTYVDLGAAWAGRTQDRMYPLLKERSIDIARPWRARTRPKVACPDAARMAEPEPAREMILKRDVLSMVRQFFRRGTIGPFA